MCLYNFIFMYEFQIDKTDEEKKMVSEGCFSKTRARQLLGGHLLNSRAINSSFTSCNKIYLPI